MERVTRLLGMADVVEDCLNIAATTSSESGLILDETLLVWRVLVDLLTAACCVLCALM